MLPGNTVITPFIKVTVRAHAVGPDKPATIRAYITSVWKRARIVRSSHISLGL